MVKNGRGKSAVQGGKRKVHNDEESEEDDPTYSEHVHVCVCVSCVECNVVQGGGGGGGGEATGAGRAGREPGEGQ